MKAMEYASKDAPTGGAPVIFVGSFILSAIIAFTLALFLGRKHVDTIVIYD